MDRRTCIRTFGGAVAAASIAGCLSRENDENGDGGEDDGELEIATYTSFIEGELEEGDSPAEWLKAEFEAEHPDVEITWTDPEEGLNLYIQQAQQNDGIDADLFIGLNVDDLVHIDDRLDDQLFETLDRDALENVDRIRDDIDFGDPHDRTLAYDTGYISLVYDESAVGEPETFEDLLEAEYENEFIVQNAQDSDPGQAFMLWTLNEYGEDGYLDYWQDLQDNGTMVSDSWTDSYFGPYSEEERSVIVSYSTDQVFQYHAQGEDPDLTRNQIGFLNGQGYENHEGMAVFADSNKTDLAYEFMDFVLTSEAQAAIAEKNVQFPAVADEHVDLEESFYQYAHEPEESVTFTYDELGGNLDGWVDDWAREIVE